jgi:hypothetical protein
MARTLDESTIEQLREHGKKETDKGVRREIDTAMALATLEDGDAAVRLQSVSTLRDRLSADVRNRLAARVEADGTGAMPETDPAVRTAITSALNRMDSMRSLYVGIEMLFFGLSLGSVLVLVAIGLAITFGVMGVINMAHGELMMLGAYTNLRGPDRASRVYGVVGAVAIPAAFLVSGLVGVALERGVIRHLYGRPLENAAGDVRRQPGPATTGAVRVLGKQSCRLHAVLDERHARCERGARHYLQPTVYRRLHDRRVRRAAAGVEAHHDRAPDQSRRAEPRHGPRDGGSQ